MHNIITNTFIKQFYLYESDFCPLPLVLLRQHNGIYMN